MKNKFLKISSLILAFGIMVSNLPSVLAGGGISKIFKKEDNSYSEGFIFYPWHYLCTDCPLENYNAKAYFRSRNNMKEFNLFLELYKNTIENKNSATTLKNSEENELWGTLPPWSSLCLPIEEHEDFYGEYYFLRVDYKNKIIYTVRKSENKYFFVFYDLLPSDKKSKIVIAARSGSIILPDKNSRNLSIIKQLLLPIDQALFD